MLLLITTPDDQEYLIAHDIRDPHFRAAALRNPEEHIMTILPTLDTVREIASAGKYTVLPVSCEILSDFTTPIETLRILKNISTHCYLLESAQANETWGRYSFLGFDPKLEITCVDGDMNDY